MPALKLTGRKSTPTRSKPAAKQASTRKSTPARKPAASKQATKQAEAQTNGSQTRGPKLPEGWSKSDFNRIVKEMQKAKAAKENAATKLSEAQEAANGMALELISEGIQMSVVSKELDLSRQWLYNLMENLYEKYGYDEPVRTERQQAARKPAAKRASRSKPAAKKTAAKKTASKPAAKKTAGRKAPARKRPAAKPTSGRGRVAFKR